MANVCNEINCLLHCRRSCDRNGSADNATDEKWSSLREKAKKWQRLVTFGQVDSSVVWEKGPKELYMHSSCYATLFNKRVLSQAERRRDAEVEPDVENIDEENSPRPPPPPRWFQCPEKSPLQYRTRTWYEMCLAYERLKSKETQPWQSVAPLINSRCLE